ncbi:addiction module toxin, RelE/StbE family [endosymbiont of Bathymodiolus septemdierum str. Myojin knoll]|uniref:Addiction module toxin, RelE/StbE family n=1 Tax=endosymbiont of Bathymodiolus septemdierum str. Myojin knoll TaxID=1303921 RepID=A0A0P0US40_9GAMM|nr:plasmid stabilization protein [Bathymodiolus septemdierum thioautotrophic gill symbiont]BAS67685.1 addiction module toxin, RelE/StbE family [endosymbiont of Bathymodiolus septemdierum str. Myojin knoll]
MIEIKFSDNYEKKAIKFLKKHKEIVLQYMKIIDLLENNPYHPSLKLHKLQGKLSKFSSVSINMKYRIVIDFIIFDDEIILVDIGSHDNAYK